MPYIVYKIIHLVAMFLFFSTAAAFASRADAEDGWYRLARAGVGFSLFAVLFGGMGLLARLGMNDTWPAWVWGKIALWMLLCAILMASRRLGHRGRMALPYLLPILGAGAAYLALFKPT